MLAAPDRELLAAIIDSSDDGIVSKTLQGIVTSWNPAAERIFGYTAAEMVGRSITVLFPPERLDEEDHLLSLIAAGERVTHFESQRVRKDGTRIEVSVTLSPVRDADGVIVGASKVVRDITDRKWLESERAAALERAQEARRAAEQANRMKDEFLATLSHELRTPLNAILGWSRMLTERSMSDADREHGIDVIQRNAEAQNRLIGDLLDMSRFMTGKIRLALQPVDLRDVITEAIDAVRLGAEAKQIAIEMDDRRIETRVVGDPDRLRQLFWNLLSNAVKFTSRRGKVVVSPESSDASVNVLIRDTGIGIAAEVLPRVFDRFMQADSSITRAHSGLGLGLALVRQIAEAHGGSVSAQSEGLGQGATFIVTLPADTGAVTAGAASPPVGEKLGGRPTSPPAILAETRVLVVDDDDDSRQLLELALGLMGAEVRTAASVDVASLTLEAWHPHVVVTDLGMPLQDGYELRRWMVETGLATVPTIALTGYTAPPDRSRVLQAGFVAHMPKPVDIPALAAMIAQAAATARPASEA
jgi:PAS domain S-box-containing protein